MIPMINGFSSLPARRLARALVAGGLAALLALAACRPADGAPAGGGTAGFNSSGLAYHGNNGAVGGFTGANIQ